MAYKTVVPLLLLFIAFCNGIILQFSSLRGSGYNVLIAIVIWAVTSLLIAYCLGGGKIIRAFKEKVEIKEIFFAILIFLILVPLAFLGTCFAAYGGMSLASIFSY